MSPKTHWYCFETAVVVFCSHQLNFDSTVPLGAKWILGRVLESPVCYKHLIYLSHLSPKTDWEFQCGVGYANFEYINDSKTHWDWQCVMETIMYFNYIFQRTHCNSQCVLETFKISNLETSLITHWEISLISVWSVWSVLWRTSLIFSSISFDLHQVFLDLARVIWVFKVYSSLSLLKIQII